MVKILAVLLCILTFANFTSEVLAQPSKYISVVNPVRGSDFWDLRSQQPKDAVLGQIAILENYNIPATWLLRFDALGDKEIVDSLRKTKNSELGIFLEVTDSFAKASGVSYRQSESWHFAESVLLTGYTPEERIKLVDKAFDEFKNVFGITPKTVGMWWVDSYTLDYLQKKYAIDSVLIVADQFSTDNYQVWGQYFGAPYYPAKKNTLFPASSVNDKIPVVVSQWAARDPVNGYGKGVEESTYSFQANDYIDFHKLDINYFKGLLGLYLNQEFNLVNSVVVGLENSYEWSRYKEEYKRQIEAVNEKKIKEGVIVATLGDFSKWYKQQFSQISPEHVVVASDLLGTDKKAIWYMNPFYRAGFISNDSYTGFRDIRQYIEGQSEICFNVPCKQLNLATSATRVLDEVTFGQRFVIDKGEAKNLKLFRNGEDVVMQFNNQAGRKREVKFLDRDIAIDGKNYSIDGAILEAIKQSEGELKNSTYSLKNQFSINILTLGFIFSLVKFTLFLILLLYIPGRVILWYVLPDGIGFGKRIFLSIVIGVVSLTLFAFGVGLLSMYWLVWLYAVVFFVIFLVSRIYEEFGNLKFSKYALAPIIVIIFGTVFQSIPTFKSGLMTDLGMVFWGPNSHDGVWHMALVNQILEGVPVENPVFAGEKLKNYHFFYDLLIAVFHYISRIDIVDLIFRFFPILFSSLVGIGSFYLMMSLFKSRLSSILGLFFIYFAGSFGWIVEYIKEGHWGGESAFWANQSISFNLNPPFAASLVIMIGLLNLLVIFKNVFNVKKVVILILITGSLLAFKAYAFIVVFLSLFIVALGRLFKRDFSLLATAVGSLILAFLIILPTFDFGENFVKTSGSLFIWSPFWFVHSMIDFPDRVGWLKLSSARNAYFERGEYFKYLLAEGLGFLIFIGGNLGTRFVAIFSLFWIGKFDSTKMMIFLIGFFSMVIPILFIQTGNPWNTIQFFYYFLYLTSIMAGFVLSRFIFQTPKYIWFIPVTVILVLTPVNAIRTAMGYFGQMPHAYIPTSEVEALSYIGSREKGVILTYPYNKNLKNKFSEPRPLLAYETTGYVSALSGNVTFLEDEIQQEILGTDVKKRLVETHEFFESRDLGWSKNFLKERDIKYIYIPKIYEKNIDAGALQLINIFENDKVVVYEVN